MKKLKLLPLLLGLLLMTSCAYHSGLVNNFNNNNTTVELSENNYRVVDYVKGSASCTYVFGIGGLDKATVVEKAKAEMYSNANLNGKARAIIYTNIDTRYTFFPIIRKMTVTASGHVIEFEE